MNPNSPSVYLKKFINLSPAPNTPTLNANLPSSGHLCSLYHSTLRHLTRYKTLNNPPAGSFQELAHRGMVRSRAHGTEHCSLPSSNRKNVKSVCGLQCGQAYQVSDFLEKKEVLVSRKLRLNLIGSILKRQIKFLSRKQKSG